MSGALRLPVAIVRVAAQRFRRGGRRALAWTVRLTTASVASYLVAVAIFPRSQPLTAPLTALLVVQLTPVSLLASGLDRVFSVVAGVTVAVVISVAVHLTWWSLAIVIAVSLLIGQALRLGSNLLEVPISAMLVLGVGSVGAESAAGQRISETLVGAGVGVLSNLLFPPRVATADAGTALRGLADHLAALLRAAALDLEDPQRGGNPEQAGHWLEEIRHLTHDLPGVGSTLIRAEQERRLNIRAAGTTDVSPGLRQAMEALEHSAVTIRGLFRAMFEASAGAWAGGSTAAALREADALVLRDLAAALEAFGKVTQSQAAGYPQEHLPALQAALEELRETRARVADLLTVEDDPERIELNFALLSAVRRVMSELDVGQHLRQESHRRSTTLRPLHTLPRPRRR